MCIDKLLSIYSHAYDVLKIFLCFKYASIMSFWGTLNWIHNELCKLISYWFFITDDILSFLLCALISVLQTGCLTNTDAHVTNGSEDGFIYFWDLVDAIVVSSFHAHSSVVNSSVLPHSISFSPFLVKCLSLYMMVLSGHGISCTHTTNIFKRVFPSSDFELFYWK